MEGATLGTVFAIVFLVAIAALATAFAGAFAGVFVAILATGFVPAPRLTAFAGVFATTAFSFFVGFFIALAIESNHPMKRDKWRDFYKK